MFNFAVLTLIIVSLIISNSVGEGLTYEDIKNKIGNDIMYSNVVSVPVESHGNCGMIKSNQTQAVLWPYYVRIPKTGSTFLQTLMRFGCPQGSFSDDVVVIEPGLFINSNPDCKQNFNYMMSSFPSYPWYLRPFNVVMMMRKVVYRVASGFLGGYDGCPTIYRSVTCANVVQNASAPRYMYSQQHIRCLDDHSVSSYQNEALISQYGSCVSGYVTNLLGGGQMPERIAGDVPPTLDLTPKMTKRAVYVTLKAAFVGLTESFDASICLFHAKFGGSVYDGEFLRAKPASHHKKEKESVISILMSKGYTDPNDDKLYEKARTRFFKEKKMYMDGWSGVVEKKRKVGKKKQML